MKFRKSHIVEGIELKDLPVVPIGYRLLIKQEVVDEVSSGGIVLATHDQTKREQRGHSIGTVVAMGGQCYDRGDWGVKLGDTVKIRPYGGAMTESNGIYRTNDENVHYHLMNDEDI